MHGPGLNLQRRIHVASGLKHKMLRAKHVKLRGKLLSLDPKLPCIREKLPSFAANRSVGVRTHMIVSVRNQRRQPSPGRKSSDPEAIAFGEVAGLIARMQGATKV